MDTSSAQDPTTATITTHASTTRPRLFWVGMAAFLIVIVFLGFGSTYGRQLVMGVEIGADGPYDGGFVKTDWAIHLHAAVFVGWMAFLLMQAILVARGRIRAHMSVGGYGGIALAALVLVVGSLITYAQIQTVVSETGISWAEWPRILWGAKDSLVGLLLFAALLGLGLLYRRRPVAHKRYMVFATVMLVVAATSRLEYLLGEWDNTVGIGVMVAPLLAYDLYTDGRVHLATLIGTGAAGIYLAVEYL